MSHNITAVATPLSDPDWNPWIDLARSQRGLSKKYQCAVWLCLLTTCRIGELLLAEKKHIDFGKGEWFIPKENSKTTRGKRRDFMIFLSPQAAVQFQILFDMAGKSRWVFPSPDKEDIARVTPPATTSWVAACQRRNG